MDAGLLKALVALVPVCMLLAGSVVMFLKARTAPLFLQLFGAACLLIVVFAYIFEALHVFPSMGWGNEQDPGHYLNLASALLGFTFFPLGYLLQSVKK